MILSGLEIAAACVRGDIMIDPFDTKCLNPNSYNFRLSPRLIDLIPFSIQKSAEDYFCITEDGFRLQPEKLYLGSTLERIGSTRYAMTLLGRSSVGRLGLFLTSTADLGHVGSCSNWTLEMSVVQPLRIYPGMPIGQIAFWTTGSDNAAYSGRYQGDMVPTRNKDVDIVGAGSKGRPR